LSDFFQPPPPEPREERDEWEPPLWLSPPRGVLPGTVALNVVLARTKSAAVCLSRVDAYPAGLTFDIIQLLSSDADEDVLDILDGRQMRRIRDRADEGELPPELLRLGVEFADGSKVTNIASGVPGSGSWTKMVSGLKTDGEADVPDGPVLNSTGGSGSSRYQQQSYWLWPIPQAGELTFVCEWPAVGLPLTRRSFDAAVFLAAAAEAQVVFEDPGSPGLVLK
jgi:hypothetical protein